MEEIFRFPVLLGDIGGTNARFALLEQDSLELKDFKEYSVCAYPTIIEVLSDYFYYVGCSRPSSMILAIATPLEGDSMRLTNSHWTITPSILKDNFSFSSIFLMNDFEAQALATSCFSERDLYSLTKNALASVAGPRLVIGPGTGLGVAGLLQIDDIMIPVPGEGGHIDYAPQTEEDFFLYPHLQANETGRLRAESLLSGAGLIRIYNAFCAHHCIKAIYETADAISMAARMGDVLALKTVRFFFSYLARLSGDLALIFKAEGGVYIGGGIMPKLLDLIDKEEFCARFINKTPHGELLKRFPIYVVKHPQNALKGMEAFVKHPKRFLMSYANRLW